MSPSKFLQNRAKQQKPVKPAGKPPLSERNYWRKEMTVQARYIRAGDAYIETGGRSRRFLHICEFGREGDKVTIKFNDLKRPTGFGREEFKARQLVKIRRTFHD
jgi:hypothetical protein